MKPALLRPGWSPYLVGAGIGVLSWLAFALAGRPLGVTTAFEHTAALVIAAVAPAARELAYFDENTPNIGWQWMLVLGIFVGAWISARLGDDRQPRWVPPLWAARFGEARAPRAIAAFFGAALMLFGARVAGGCTTGHGISGNLQLALSSMIFTLTFAIVGVLVALGLYGRNLEVSDD